jgi:hypothetical protein
MLLPPAQQPQAGATRSTAVSMPKSNARAFIPDLLPGGFILLDVRSTKRVYTPHELILTFLARCRQWLDAKKRQKKKEEAKVVTG